MSPTREREVLDRKDWSARQRRQYQQKRLRAVLSHAIKNVPFYQQHFHQHGLTERDVRHLKDLSLLPFTFSKDLENEPEKFLTRGVNRRQCRARQQPGRSEKPLCVYLSDEENTFIQWLERRIETVNGLGPRSSRLAIVPPREIPPPAGWLDRWRRGLRRYASAYETSEEQMRILREMRPERILAPLWILNTLADMIIEHTPLGFCPRLLLSWGEPMRSNDRERLQEAFGVAPIDLYQSWEFGPIAAEAPEHEGLPVNFDLCYVEILRSDGHPCEPGEPGEVAVTSLANQTMPLIRYRIGDLASWKRCPTSEGGERLVLEAVHGRVEHSIRLPSGGYVTALQFEECLDQFTNIKAYRAYLVEPRKVEVHIIPDKLFQDKTAELLRKKCIELFSSRMGVELKTVRVLPIMDTPRRCPIVRKVEQPEMP